MRMAVLGLLVERPTHRYELAVRFGERIGPSWGIRRAQVYQAANGMEKEGLVERVEETEHGKAREIFRATARGQEVFEAWLASDAAEDPGPVRNALFIRLGFLRSEHVPALLEVVDKREYVLLSRIREYSEACPELGPPSEPADWTALGFHLILDGTVATLQGELRWLRRVRETLESQLVAHGEGGDGGTVA